MNFRIIFQICFLAFGIAEVLATIYWQEIRVFTKPMIMIILMLFFQYQTLGIRSVYKSIFLLALFFAWLGDVLLLQNGEIYFMLGLGSFLQMQILYAYLFFKKSKFDKSKLVGVGLILFLGLVIVYPVLRASNQLLLPVLCYFMAILAMVTFAYLRTDISKKSYILVLGGAIFFLVSDAFLAYNKFVVANETLSLLVMPTYIIAQYFVVEGLTPQTPVNDFLDA